MAKIRADNVVDRFMTGPNDNMEHPFGLNGHRLHAWLSEGEVDRSRTGPQRSATRKCSTS